MVGGMLVCGSGEQQEPGHVPQREVVGRKVRLWWRNRINGYTAGILTSNPPVRLAWFLPEVQQLSPDCVGEHEELLTTDRFHLIEKSSAAVQSVGSDGSSI